MPCNINIDSQINSVQGIYIACPEYIKDALEMDNSKFEMLGNPAKLFLRLPCDRSQYSPRFVNQGGDPEILHSFSEPIVGLRSYKRLIEANIQDERLEIYYALEAISQDSVLPDLTGRKPITLVDCVLPEWKDFAQAKQNGTNPFSVRFGVIMKIQPTSGSVGRGPKRYLKGFNLIFEEPKLRLM